MVPNSLGPGELLLHYGTEEQKNYYLPRLARGEEIPCFGLTGPTPAPTRRRRNPPASSKSAWSTARKCSACV